MRENGQLLTPAVLALERPVGLFLLGNSRSQPRDRGTPLLAISGLIP
jgi:hypothetical protein